MILIRRVSAVIKSTVFTEPFQRDQRGDGTWQPYVVISRSSDGELVANRFFPTDFRFTDEAAAIAHARDWAVRWIDASSVTI
jgi:hypothetical protein